jgi:hypothetical protein
MRMRLIAGVAVAMAVGAGAAWADMPDVPPYQPPLEGAVENSFVAGTKILTDNGFVNIEDLQNGDVVVSWDADAERQVSAQISGVNSRTERSIYEMGIGGQVIQLTRDHPFLTTRGWKRVIETSIGATIIGYDGAEYRIETCRTRRGEYTVYNFEVDITGTYFVSDLRLLAH